ncbi:enoyl-CoA hydratase [Alteromonas sp. a30]|nr:enoyl-CoA hydratase [Alteromonas sp. a30]
MSNIQIQLEQQILTITMARADKYNALTPQMYGAMANALESVKEENKAKAVLIQGEGKHFSAGNDLSTFASIDKEDTSSETVRFMNALMDCPVPVVAKVRGQAVGIGTTLLLHCDLVFADDSATLCMPFINLALVPEFAASWVLPKLSGHVKAAEWLMLGEPIPAQEAYQYKLVNRIVEAEKLDSHVDAIMTKLALKPGLAMRHTKALLKHEQESVKAHMAEELDIFFSQLTTEPAKEAFAAFLEKRAPDPKKFN